MKDYRKIAESVLERRDKYLEMQKRRRLAVIKMMSSVIGVAVTGCLSITVYNNSIIHEIKPNQNNNSYNVNDYTKPTSETSVTTETHDAIHTTSVQTAPASVYTENTPTAVTTTEISVIPTSTAVHTTEMTVYTVPEYTSATMPVTIEQTYFTSAIETNEIYTTVNTTVATQITVPTTIEQTYFTSAIKTNETYTTVNTTATTQITVPVTIEQTYFTSAIKTNEIYTTVNVTTATDFVSATKTTITMETPNAVTSATNATSHTENNATTSTEIPETFVLATVDNKKISYTEICTTTVV